jgi:hypothetical protein
MTDFLPPPQIGAADYLLSLIEIVSNPAKYEALVTEVRRGRDEVMAANAEARALKAELLELNKRKAEWEAAKTAEHDLIETNRAAVARDRSHAWRSRTGSSSRRRFHVNPAVIRSVLLSLLLCGGCAQLPQEWIKADGSHGTQQQLALDTTACRGELERAQMTRTRESPIGAGREVYVGCMAGKGWMEARSD